MKPKVQSNSNTLEKLYPTFLSDFPDLSPLGAVKPNNIAYCFEKCLHTEGVRAHTRSFTMTTLINNIKQQEI